ncbi:transcriptional corepressor LEUNIG-like protein [Citrus sinensis]|nr:transcriptional corepressor LEUNIG-like protein [Citrus sinensis]
MAQQSSNWEADKMLDVYIYDYLVKKKLHNTAKSFMTEGKVAPDPVAIDAPGGFLFEWWSVFWDIFIARTNEKHSEPAASYIEAQQIKTKEQQQLQMQQLHLMRAQMQQRNPNHPSLGGAVNSVNSEGMVGQSNASALAAKMYEERMKHNNSMGNSMGSETSQPLLDARMALLKSANHPGQLVQGNHGSVNAALQQIQARSQQTPDIKGEMNLGTSQRSMPMDPSSLYSQGIMQSKPGLGNAGLSPGVGGLPLKGWPLTGIDQIRPSLGAQVQKPFLQGGNQFQLLPQQQQQLIAQAQAQGNLGNTMYGEMDPRRFGGLPRSNLNTKDGQSIANDGSIGSPMQSTSSKMNMPQIQQSSSQQQDPLQPPQTQQNNRKRKGPSSSGAANSGCTGNTVGPSPNSQPSTPSTHTPGDAVAMSGSMQHVSNVPKGLMMYGSDGTGGHASSTNQLDDMEHFGDIGSLDDNVESFLSQDDGDGRDLFGSLKRNPSEQATETSKAFSFNEVSSIRKSSSKVTCCHFSSDGKLLASAGHDKKVVVWNMENFQTECTPDDHNHIITDVRFRPNSTQLATSSFDKTVRIWDAAKTYTGHNNHVMSLDFHPKKNDLFCSCDGNSEIRFWNLSQYSCARISKGGTVQVRFQPRLGLLLAAASENVVSIFDVETDRLTHSFKGHSTEIHSVCWDTNGEYLASVSQDSVRVWSLASGECIHELSSSGNKFHSCIFHPSYPTLMVIGGYQSLELWNMAENKCMTIAAHDCVISALAQSPLDDFLRDEEKYWRQRSKALWLKEGDRNTKYFHAKASGRRKRILIVGLLDNNNQWIEDITAIENEFSDYFRNLFTSSNPSAQSVELALQYIEPKVTAEMNMELDKMFSPEEIQVPDGLSAGFFQRCRKQGKEGLVAVKLDISKAYDRIEWCFVEGIMRKLGFSTRWVSLTMKCIMSPTFAFLLNGEVRGLVMLQRGLRQGCPLSPYLFILCAESLSSLLVHAENHKFIHGIKFGVNGPIVSHLFFADGSLVFSKASVAECNQLKELFDLYSNASGQVINFQKSSLFFSPNTPGNIREAIKHIFNLSVVSHHEQYLGLPSMLGRSKKFFFNTLKARLWHKIKDWKTKLFPSIGKEVLIKAVAQAIPTYVMSVFKLPLSFCDDLQKIITQFWWSQNSSSRSFHWLLWLKLCLSKKYGGLGFRVLSSFSIALMAKQYWRLISCPHSLVSKVLKVKYYPRGNFMESKLGSNPSYVWRSILWGGEVIEASSIWRIGDGKNVSIYHHRWFPRPSTFKPFSPWLLPFQSRVAILIDEEGCCKEQLIRNHFLKEDATQILKIPLPKRPLEDQLENSSCSFMPLVVALLTRINIMLWWGVNKRKSEPQAIVAQAANAVNSFRADTLQRGSSKSIKPNSPRPCWQSPLLPLHGTKSTSMRLLVLRKIVLVLEYQSVIRKAKLW